MMLGLSMVLNVANLLKPLVTFGWKTTTTKNISIVIINLLMMNCYRTDNRRLTPEGASYFYG